MLTACRQIDTVNWTGIVTISFTVDEGGNVREVYVDRSSGFDLLDKVSIEYIKAAKFSPATLQGKPVHQKRNMEFEFKLN